jgi:hypothetical protein
MPNEHTSSSSPLATDRAPSETPRSILIPETVLANLLHRAAFAAHLVGHLDDKAQPELVRQLGDHVDTIAHELAELLGAPNALAEPDAAAPDDRKVSNGAPMLTSIAGGAP